VKVFGSDIRHIKQGNTFTLGKKLFYKSPLYIFLNLLPLLIWGGIILYQQLQRSQKQNSAYFKASRAYGKALRRLKAVGKKGGEEGLGQLEIIFAEYIGSKVNRSGAGLSVADIKCILLEKVREGELVENAAKLFEELHFLRFAPAGSDMAELSMLAERIREMIIKLEKAGL
jgi:hypothetical protein